MKQILDSLDSAASLTARRLTSGLRRSAYQHGWSPEVTRNLSVNYDGKGFGVSVPDEYRDQMMDFEYGNESRRPTAVIRKFKNHNIDSKAFFGALNTVVKGSSK